MKKIWKMNNKAVSPVIATILMVAITVVLAAVLYVMVMGFGGETDNAPSVTLSRMSTANGVDIVIAIDSSVDVDKIGVSLGGTTYAFADDTAAPYVGFNVTQASPGSVSTGDRIIISTNELPAAGTTLQLVWMPNGIAGGDQQFTGTIIEF